MTRISTFARVLALGVGALCVAQAVHAQTSDWPCQQRLMPTLEPGQMWSDPPVDAAPTVPPAELSALTQQLTALHQSPEALAAAVQAFADGLPADQKSARLSLLFAVALQRLNGERATLINGIKRYARGQQRMAEKISAETRALDALRKESGTPPERIADLQAERDWDARVFTERQHSLQLVCEQPVLLEQRAFALARLIQDKLP